MKKSFGNRAAASVIILIAASGMATAQASQDINVPSQPLEQALTELSTETGLSILAQSEFLQGKVSNAVEGQMSPTQALAELIADKGLKLRSIEAGRAVVSRDVVTQNEDQGFLDLGTIILRGERVERDVFKTASSVRAFSGEELEENVQNRDVERVIDEVANVVVISNSNFGPFIRGQSSAGPLTGAGAAISGQLPRANIVVDGRVQNFNELAYSPTSIWDLDTIEVFRGPQTTSQGANAIAGAINLRTRDPIFEQEFALRSEVGTNDRRVVALMANLPLSQSVAARFTYEHSREDGYINFATPVQPSEDARRISLSTARLKLLWEPVSLPQLSNKITLTYTDFNRPQTQNVTTINPVPGGNPFRFRDLVSNNVDGFPSRFTGQTYGIIHDASYDFENGVSIRNQLQYNEQDVSRLTGNPTLPTPEFPTTAEDWSNELILDYAPEGSAFSGFAGIYIRETVEQVDPGSAISFNDYKYGLGVFAETTYRFGGGFDVTGGIRYQENSQNRFVNAAILPVAVNYQGNFDAFLPKVSLGYEPKENLRFAFQVSRGFNPGGITGPTFLIITGFAPNPPFSEFQEETVTNYELSMRGRFLEDRLFISANAFYSDYEDYQFLVPVFFPGAPFSDSIVNNAESVETYGLEIDAQFEASARLQIQGSLGVLQSEVTGFSAPTVTPLVGNDIPFAPDVTATLGATFFVTDRFSVGGQIRYTSNYYSDITNDPTSRISEITTVDLRAAYDINDRAQLYGYINNVFDVIEPTQLFLGGTNGVTTKPREFGLGVRANW